MNEGLRVQLPQQHLRKISMTGGQGVKWTPLPTPKDEVKTTRTLQNGSIFSTSRAHLPKKESGEQWGAGGEAPCLSLSPPPAAQPGERSAPVPSGNWAPGWGAHLTGPCSWEISCETCFKPPNHKNGRFSQPCSHVSQISRGVFSISIRETPGQPPAPGEQENGAEAWVLQKPSGVCPKHTGPTTATAVCGLGKKMTPAPDKGNWKSGQRHLEAARSV